MAGNAAATAWRMNWYVALILIVYAIAGQAVGTVYGFSLDIDLYRPSWLLLPLATGAAAVAVLRLRELLGGRQPPRPLGSFLGQPGIAVRAAVGGSAFVLLLMFFSVYSSLKLSIDLVRPYQWDQSLAALDEAIHGVAPWKLLHPLLGTPAITKAIDVLYMLWIPAMLLVLATVAAWIERPLLRAQYLIAFMLTWSLLGSLGAIMLSSVGPCFYGLLAPTEIDPYAPLLSYLRDVHETYGLSALRIPRILWEAFTTKVPSGGSGISAMPSIHVAVATLNALLAWRISNRVGIVATLYLLIIMAGSVHLGWHYAVDGYASLAAVPLIWTLAGWLARFPTPTLERFRAVRSWTAKQPETN